MDYYKLLSHIAQNYERQINETFMENYREQNPKDKITTGYCQTTYIAGYGYIPRDIYTEQFITDYIEIVDQLPSGWHEENKMYQVYMTQDQAIDFALSPYSETMKQWREEKGIELHRDNGVYFYLNFWEPGHRDIIKQFATITPNMNI
jgi:hypothetical protein